MIILICISITFFFFGNKYINHLSYFIWITKFDRDRVVSDHLIFSLHHILHLSFLTTCCVFLLIKITWHLIMYSPNKKTLDNVSLWNSHHDANYNEIKIWTTAPSKMADFLFIYFLWRVVTCTVMVYVHFENTFYIFIRYKR